MLFYAVKQPPFFSRGRAALRSARAAPRRRAFSAAGREMIGSFASAAGWAGGSVFGKMTKIPENVVCLYFILEAANSNVYNTP